MIRVLIFFAIVAAIAWGVALLADDVPGTVTVNLVGQSQEGQDLEVQVDLFFVIVGLLIIIPLLILLWSLLVRLVTIPSGISRLLMRRKESRGLEALSGGMIAVSSGNRYLAEKNSAAARRALPNEPLTALLRAQTAQICGDRLTARRIYEGMLSSPDTELLGLRGLFLEAQKEKEYPAARQFAERAVRLDPKLAWAVNSLFDYQCRNGDWEDALRTLETARHYSHVTKAEANRRRAVLLTAQAQSADENGDLDRAVELAQKAHGLAPNLVPAAEIAGRILASKGSTSRAAKVLTKTWKLSPHPDLAYAFAFARPGDSPKDRLKRVQSLASLKPHSVEAPISEALAAIDAREWGIARDSLKRLIKDQPSARVCTLMARIEAGEFGDKGRVREWLARGLRAPRDPSWIADGYVSDHWMPVSPVTGRLDSFEWKVPLEPAVEAKSELFVEELMQLGSASKDALVESSGGREASLIQDITPAAVMKETGARDGKSDSNLSGIEFPMDREKDKISDVQTVRDDLVSKKEESELHSEKQQSSVNSETISKSVAVEVNGSGKTNGAKERFTSDGSDSQIVAPAVTEMKSETDNKDAVKFSAEQAQSVDSGTKGTSQDKGQQADTGENQSSESGSDEKRPEKVVEEAEVSDVDDRMGRRKPKIFVPPRAPDDPGPEPLDPDEARTALARYRTSPSKADP